MSVIIIHITVALLSLGATAAAFLMPSRFKLRLSQALIAFTLASGTYLVFTMHVNLLRVCAVGLIYTAIVSCGIVAAHRKLTAQQA